MKKKIIAMLCINQIIAFSDAFSSLFIKGLKFTQSTKYFSHLAISPTKQDPTFDEKANQVKSSEGRQQTALLWLAHNRLRINDNVALQKAAELGPDGLAICLVWPYSNKSKEYSTSIEVTPAEAFGYAAVRALNDALGKFGQKLWVIPTRQISELEGSDRCDASLAVAEIIKNMKPQHVVVDVSSLDLHRDRVSKLRKVLNDTNVDVVDVLDDGMLFPFEKVAKTLGRSRQGGRSLRWTTFLTNAMKILDEEGTDKKIFEMQSLPPILSKSNDVCNSYDLPPQADDLPQWTQILLSRWGEISEEEAIYRAKNACRSTNVSSSSQLTEQGSKDSMISPYLRWGVISPQRAAQHRIRTRDILWRDWSYICYRLLGPIRRKEAVLKFLDDSIGSTDLVGEQNEKFLSWCVGNTGSDLVDAGMRQLWHEGWMPRRIRLLAAGCLVEGLGLNFRHGRDWFEYTLIDHDPAINELMWQNAGLCGVDPFYRGIKWEASPKCVEDEEYVQYWLHKELVWPTPLRPYAESRKSFEWIVEATLQRDILAQKGIYKAARAVSNSGVRVAWPGLLSPVEEGEVMGVGLIPLKELI